jgi:acetylornithine deacetylase/succinyl-diaminopimelate desuccinylase-like protein
MRLPVLLLCAASACFSASAQSTIRAYVDGRKPEILREFSTLLAIPNVASDKANIGRNATAIIAALKARGVEAQSLEVPGAPPAVFGEIRIPGAKRTLGFYAHYDGQPVDPKQWTGAGPFEPVLRNAMNTNGGKVIPIPKPGERVDSEWRLYARSSSDDKAAIQAMLIALDALKATGTQLQSNIKFLFEGEEEAGSKQLGEILRQHKDKLAADVWYICDGPVDQSRRQQIFFGVRGVVGFELTLYGPNRELHSGHYGNWAPNPAMALAQLLATMKDANGRVLIEEFYKGMEPLGARERQALSNMPPVEPNLMEELGLAFTEGSGRKLADLINEPSLNIRGLRSVDVGAQARNVVPSQAVASIDVRLVKGITPQMTHDRIAAHLRAHGFHVVTADPDQATRRKHPKIAKLTTAGGYNAARTSMDLEISQVTIAAVEKARGPIVLLPTMGGSVPLYMFEEVLKTPLIGIPIANHDNNQHSFDENIRLQNLWDGIETMAALMTIR